jgi:hypothetical protein
MRRVMSESKPMAGFIKEDEKFCDDGESVSTTAGTAALEELPQDSSGSLWACAVIEFGAYYVDLARFVLGFPPRTVKGLRRWILFYCLSIGYYGDNGYASLSPSGRASLKDPSVQWDGRYSEHPMTEFLHKLIHPIFGPKVPRWFIHIIILLLHPVFITALLFYPIFAVVGVVLFRPIGKRLSSCCLLLRRPDLLASVDKMHLRLGRQPVLADHDVLHSELYHAGFENWLRNRYRKTADLICSKPMLHEAMKEHNIPTIPIVDLAAAEKPPLPWFAKPPRDAFGNDCRMVETAEEAATLRPGRDFVQVAAKNHETLQPFFPELVTLRVFTGSAKTVSVMDCCLQIPLKGSVISNVSKGNVCAVVDMESGTLGRGTRVAGQIRDTVSPLFNIEDVGGEAFAGTTLPFFHEAIQMAKELHENVLREHVYLGTDIALTPDGPKIIETNMYCSTTMFCAALTRMDHSALMDLLVTRMQMEQPDRFKFVLESASAFAVLLLTCTLCCGSWA